MLYEKKGRYIVEFPDIPTKRQHQVEIGLEERRNNYVEVELGFDEQRALTEAKRCLSCRRCLGCALCWAECKPEAIVFEMEDEMLELEADEVIISPGVERPLGRIDKRFGLGGHPNVITDLQFERMLSKAGPSAGLVVRPYDGEIPNSIAFVQSFAPASPQMHSAALCYGINEAILAKCKLTGARIEVLGNNLEAFLKEHEGAIKQLQGIALKEAPVSAIEAAEDQTIKVTMGSNGTKESANFDLVVLMTEPQLSSDAKALSKTLGLSLAYANFLTEGSGFISTDKEVLKLTAQA
jgi:heterodisulfide reductase subunit A-like polyferredoxin